MQTTIHAQVDTKTVREQMHMFEAEHNTVQLIKLTNADYIRLNLTAPFADDFEMFEVGGLYRVTIEKL